MKKRITRVAAMLMAVMMLLSMAGCGSEEKKSEESKSSTPTSSGTVKAEEKESSSEVKEEDPYAKKVTFSITSTVAEENFGPEVDYIKEKFNVDFEIINVTTGEWAEKVRIWMATDSMPDVMQFPAGAQTFGEYVTWAEQGLLRDITDVGDHPLMQAYVEEYKMGEYFEVNDKKYAWVSANYDDLNNEASAVTGYSFIYRRDWAQDLGLYKEGDVYTWEEFEAFLYAVVENNMSGSTNGTAGFASVVAPHGIGIMQYSPFWEGYKKVGDQYVWGFGLPETLEGIQWANRLYNDGIMWVDQNIAKAADIRNKFMNGEMGVIWDNYAVYQLGSYVKNMPEILDDFDVNNDIAAMHVLGPDGRPWGQGGNGSVNYNYLTAFSPKLTEEEINRIFDIFEWYLSEEGYYWQNYGMEGYNYTKDADGKITRIQDTLRGNPFTSKGMVCTYKFAVDRDVNIATYGEKAVLMNESVIDFHNTYGRDAFLIKYPEIQLCTSEYYSKYGSCYKDGVQVVNKLIYSEGDPTAAWNEWKASVQDKINLVLAELNANN